MTGTTRTIAGRGTGRDGQILKWHKVELVDGRAWSDCGAVPLDRLAIETGDTPTDLLCRRCFARGTK